MSTTETEARLTDRLIRLADHAATAPTRSLDARSVVLLDLEPVRRRSRIPASVAAGVVAVAVIGSVVAVAEDSDPGSRAGITATAPNGDASFDQGDRPPDIQLAGWSKTDSESQVAPPTISGDRVFFVLAGTPDPFEGTRIRVGVSDPGGSFTSGPWPDHVDVNGKQASVGTEGNKAFVVWSPVPEHLLYVEGTDTTTEQVVDVARGVRVTPDVDSVTINAGAVPAGMQVIKAAQVVTDPVVKVDSKFERDGVQMHVRLDGTGRDAFESSLDGTERTVTVRGQQAALRTEDGGSYVLRFVDGRWAVEISGGPFVSEQAFFEAVDSLVVTPAR